MVATAEAAGTRTVALLTDMDQPLGYAAGNWIELVESVELLRGQRPPESEDLRELSLILAGWMIHLGGKSATPEQGHQLAEAALEDGSALGVFFKMIEAQSGDISVFDQMDIGPARMGGSTRFFQPGATDALSAWQSGYISTMDTTKIGWAVQRTGAGREKAGEPVDPHAGILFHARRGAKVEHGQPIATLYATTAEMLPEPLDLLQQSITISQTPPDAVPLVSRILTRESAETYLQNAVR
jgi:pyrimidine-nucleoside phosphorylase